MLLMEGVALGRGRETAELEANDPLCGEDGGMGLRGGT